VTAAEDGATNGEAADVVNVAVRTLTGRTAALQLTPAATVQSVKELVEMQWEIPVQEQRLVYANEELNPPLRSAFFCRTLHASICVHDSVAGMRDRL
jgi:hypothetical protein